MSAGWWCAARVGRIQRPVSKALLACPQSLSEPEEVKVLCGFLRIIEQNSGRRWRRSKDPGPLGKHQHRGGIESRPHHTMQMITLPVGPTPTGSRNTGLVSYGCTANCHTVRCLEPGHLRLSPGSGLRTPLDFLALA